MNIVVVNSGSSSLKMSKFSSNGKTVPLAVDCEKEQDIDWQNESPKDIELKISDALSNLKSPAAQKVSDKDIEIVGHRIVHGGPKYLQPIELSDQVIAELEELNEFAPLHNPINLSALKHVKALLPKARHVAVFDTAFHATLPPAAALYPVPYQWYSESQIKKYGFHGISHKYCSARVSELLKRSDLRIVSCHLGGGCSLAAVLNGKSIDTTMGFTPLDGLMMRSRSGSIDPGILIYMLKNNKYTVDDLDRVLNKESGMKGVYEKSADLREIEKALSAGDERAELTVEMFLHRLTASIAAMAAALQGIDALIFTGGIGEHSRLIRREACKRLEFLRLSLDEKENDASPVDMDIATESSPVRIFVLKAREDWQIASECVHLLA